MIVERVEQLTIEEALGAKALWSEIFFEDSAVFTDYYFQEKMKNNIGYGIKQDGQLIAMLYLTPYTGQIYAPAMYGEDFADVPLSYIVGVGTKREYRHKGCMDRLLKRALKDLHERQQPFTFLMPASAAIYTPYQFRYIYERPEFIIKNQDTEPMQQKDAEALAEFAQEQLKAKYQFFLKRDGIYYLRQQKESGAQNGNIYLWKEQGEIKGFYLYAKEAEEFIQEAVVSEELTKQGMLCVSEKRKPIIMARITNVAAMLSLIRLKQNSELEKAEILLRVTDSLIPQNNGTFCWTVGKKESTIALLEKSDMTPVCVDIADLTEFLFGKRSSEECFCFSNDIEPHRQRELYERLSEIAVISRTFLNEIV